MVEINNIIVHYSIYGYSHAARLHTIGALLYHLRLERQHCICVSIVVLLLQLHVLVHQLYLITFYYIQLPAQSSQTACLHYFIWIHQPDLWLQLLQLQIQLLMYHGLLVVLFLLSVMTELYPCYHCLSLLIWRLISIIAPVKFLIIQW